MQAMKKTIPLAADQDFQTIARLAFSHPDHPGCRLAAQTLLANPDSCDWIQILLGLAQERAGAAALRSFCNLAPAGAFARQAACDPDAAQSAFDAASRHSPAWLSALLDSPLAPALMILPCPAPQGPRTRLAQLAGAGRAKGAAAAGIDCLLRLQALGLLTQEQLMEEALHAHSAACVALQTEISAIAYLRNPPPGGAPETLGSLMALRNFAPAGPFETDPAAKDSPFGIAFCAACIQLPAPLEALLPQCLDALAQSPEAPAQALAALEAAFARRKSFASFGPAFCRLCEALGGAGPAGLAFGRAACCAYLRQIAKNFDPSVDSAPACSACSAFFPEIGFEGASLALAQARKNPQDSAGPLLALAQKAELFCLPQNNPAGARKPQNL